MYRKVLVEPAKSSKSTCFNCKRVIEKGALRMQVADDRQFRRQIQRNGGAHNMSGQGLSRGYFEGPGQSISIKKYYVHMQCYRPVHVHPYILDYFDLKGCKQADRQVFNQWLNSPQKHNAALPALNEQKKKKKDEDENYGAKKKKRIKK